MNFLKFKFGKDKMRFKAPDSWHEVPYYKFLQYHTQNLPIEKVYELFTGISADDWKKPHAPELYNAVNGQLAFLSEEPKILIPKYIERNGEFYKVSKDFLNVPLGKYQDLLSIVRKVTKEANNSLEMMPKMVAIFACNDYKDDDELNEITKEVEKMPADVVYSLGCFFLSGLKRLNSGTQKSWLKVASQKMLTTLRLVLVKLLMSMAFSILLITSPKVMLRSIKKYLIVQWERFTTPSIYGIVSISQKHNTID